MPEVPKIVYDRLRATPALPALDAPEATHPDADLLTSFAEQRLSATEREDVLEHLSLCGDCREVVSLALPAEENAVAAEIIRAAPLPAKAERNWLIAFAWPSLRWAALAAGVAIGAAVLLIRPGKLNQAMPPSVNSPIATVAPPAATQKIESAQKAESLAPAGTELPKPERHLSKKVQPGQVVTPAPPAESGVMLADTRSKSAPVDKLSSAPAVAPPAFASGASNIPAMSETVEVTAASPVVQSEASTENRQLAGTRAPAIMKAKPAPQAEANQAQNTISGGIGGPSLQGRNVAAMAKLAAPSSPAATRVVTWSIASGVLQRSLDSGRNWESALHPDLPLLCYASRGRDVWTGGQAGTLFHSADDGVTWGRTRPSSNNDQLTSDITRIDLHSNLEIVITTGNNETWSSADAGNTWEKK